MDQMRHLTHKSGFSVVFGSTGCSGSVGGRAPCAPLARTLSVGGTNSPPTPPGKKIGKIGLSKMQFPAFLLGPELVNREGLLRR